jgi:hypothetical protein
MVHDIAVRNIPSEHPLSHVEKDTRISIWEEVWMAGDRYERNEKQ